MKTRNLTKPTTPRFLLSALIGLVICFSFVLSGCSTGDEPMTAKDKIKFSCIDGVEYILFREKSGYAGYGYMAPHFRADGSLYLCER